MDDILDAARKSLERIQTFDTEELPRVSQLGDELNFKDAKVHADRVIKLFRQIPIDLLNDIPRDQTLVIQSGSDVFYSILTEIMNFKITNSEHINARNILIDRLTSIYQSLFNQLHLIISYMSSRQRDFAAMERDYRARMQISEDKAVEEMKRLAAHNEAAERILDEVRKVAAEQGVSQQARYFQQESAEHDKEALKWQIWTIRTAVGLGVYAVISAFFHRFEWLASTDPYQAVQLGLSKILIFAVLAYMLLLCARNFLSHKHNAIVNKHRQNALLTFNALVEAAGTSERQDVILTYAAACIFSPQETGYTKSSASGQSEIPLNIIQALPKLASGGASH